jgi:hypothetical protein
VADKSIVDTGSSKNNDVMGAFKDSELGGTIKLKNATIRNGKKPTSNWKERAKQLEEKGTNTSAIASDSKPCSGHADPTWTDNSLPQPRVVVYV